MGCICSFFKALTSYHGSHLTPKQVERQRQQRARKGPPGHPPAAGHPTSSPSCMTPEKDPAASCRSPVAFKAAPTEEDRLLSGGGSAYSSVKPPKLHMGGGPPDHDRQGSFGSHHSGRFSLGGSSGGSMERQPSFGTPRFGKS